MILKVGKQTYEFGAAYRKKSDAAKAAKAYRSGGYLIRVVKVNIGSYSSPDYTYRVFWRLPKHKR